MKKKAFITVTVVTLLAGAFSHHVTRQPVRVRQQAQARAPLLVTSPDAVDREAHLIGAAAGAAAGALIGHAIQEDRAREYGPEPEGGYPVAEWSGTPGLVISPFPPHRLVDVRGIPRGALVRDPSSGGIFRKP